MHNSAYNISKNSPSLFKRYNVIILNFRINFLHHIFASFTKCEQTLREIFSKFKELFLKVPRG